MRALLCLALPALLLGCGVSEDNGLVGGDGGGDGRDRPDEFADAAPLQACEKMDILFVIDNSGSMSEEQSNLISNFSGFASLIDDYLTSTGNPLDYRIAVTTAGRDVSYRISVPILNQELPFSEPGDNGNFRRGCGMDRGWIEKADSDVVGTFSC